jgi:aminoglycoside/choline kinase family phosphotransferase
MAYFTPEALHEIVAPIARELAGGGAVRIAAMRAALRCVTIIASRSTGRPSPLARGHGAGETATRSEEASRVPRRPSSPFINVQRYLAAAGVAVPVIHRYDQSRGLLYLEDLGDVTFESRVAAAPPDVQRRHYRAAIDQLVTLQRYAADHIDPACVAFGRAFDFDLLLWELDHFREYGLEAQGHMPSPAERAELDRHFRAIATRLAESPRLFAHRDYQSRNLMVQDAPGGELRLRVIDFQDALLATAAYDLVGLLRDSYVELAPALLDDLVAYHADRAGRELASFRALFDLQTVQRKLKDAGRFVFIDRVKKNPNLSRTHSV